MLTIIGWFTLVIIVGYLTFIAAVLSFNNFGKYNIGGVPNAIISKILTFIYCVFVVSCWYGIFIISPFKIII